jgi:hypothetical protein
MTVVSAKAIAIIAKIFFMVVRSSAATSLSEPAGRLCDARHASDFSRLGEGRLKSGLFA